MRKITAEEGLLRAYRLLDRITPLPVDCGRFCERACCKGDDHTGMGLFPGEKEFFQDLSEYTIVSTEDNEGYPLCVCKGMCKRETRPLACRIFPYFPLVYPDENTGRLEIRVIRDPRSFSVCPLTQQEIDPQSIFERRLRRAARWLLREPSIRQYLLETSQFISDILLLQEKLR